MSGIVGLVNFDGEPVDDNTLSRLTDFMSYRGPDAQRFWIDANVGLGHSLLRTTGEQELEDQPLSLDGHRWLVADARIDSRYDLIEKLAGKLNRSTTQSRIPTDAELILLAFEAWEEKCIEHLIGDFAFAIYDKRSSSLFCARDHFGVKPFFYAYDDQHFLFSNTLNVLRLCERVSDTLNEVAIGDYLLLGLNQDLSSTTFRDIQRLPPGHTLLISNSVLKTRQFWAPASRHKIDYRDSQSYVERFDELFKSAIRDRLRTNRVSVSMSGGLDSTSIAYIARSNLKEGGQPRAYSIVYDSLISDDERHYAEAAAQHIGISLTHISADQFALFDAIPEDMNQPEPFLISPLSGQFFRLLRLCAENGRVALTGYDGDALMNERERTYFFRAAKRLQLKKLITGLGLFIAAQKRLPRLGIRTGFKQMAGKPNADSFYPDWIDEAFAKRINLRERLKELPTSKTDTEARPDAVRMLTTKVWAPLFEGYDPGATKLSLEFRHPYIDLRLVEYLLSIPAVPWCVNKHILRRAMSTRLPDQVLDRPKTPLGGDPALQLSQRASVRWLDDFEVSEQLKCFVNLDRRHSIAEEKTPDGVWSNLRVVALNYWLSNSWKLASPD